VSTLLQYFIRYEFDSRCRICHRQRFALISSILREKSVEFLSHKLTDNRCQHTCCYEFRLRLYSFKKNFFHHFIGPENGFPSATNVGLVVVVVVVVVSPKAFSFRNRSLLNFAYRLVTIFSTIAPCRILKLSPFNQENCRA